LKDEPAGPALVPVRRWTLAEATLLRATALLHFVILGVGLLAPSAFLSPYGLPFAEPATFLRATLLAYGALGLALLRALRLSRGEGRLLVETVALVKLAVFAVIVADTFAQKIPRRATIAASMDLVFGLALYRAARR
jgi:hypothetical protein